MQRVNNPADIAEEQSAASRILQALSGTPIMETSGDINHQIIPLSASFDVKLSETGGDLVVINIMQPDRHHPSLVYPTITNILNSMPEFQKEARLKPMAADEIYNNETGVISIAYELPKGGADHLIHDLSQSFEQANQTSWASKMPQTADKLPQAMAEAGNWMEKIMQMFKPQSGKDMGI